MQFHPTVRSAGFSLIEVLVAVLITGLVASGLAVAFQPTLIEQDAQFAEKNCASLNVAMSTYRGYVTRGYAPVTAWSANSAAGILNELAKPLIRGGAVVVVMPDAPRVDLSIGHLQPSNFTSFAVWSVGP